MMKNNKGQTLAPRTLVTLILAVAALMLFVFPAYSAIKSGFNSYNDAKFTASFDEFFTEVENQKEAKNKVSLMIKNGGGLFGFSQSSPSIQCVNCNTNFGQKSFQVKKPAVSECTGSSCICYCLNFRLEKIMDGEEEFCKKERLHCKKVEQDIPSYYAIEVQEGFDVLEDPESFAVQDTNSYVAGGFMYGTGYSYLHDAVRTQLINDFVVEKRDGKLGICSNKLNELNKGCIPGNNPAATS